MEQIAKRIFDDEYWGGSRVTFEGWDGLNEFEKLAAKTFEEGIENTLEQMPPDMSIQPNKDADDSIRCQKPKDHLHLNASLTHESCCAKFGIVIGIRAVKPHADNLPCKPRFGNLGRRVLSYGQFATPLAARADVASYMVVGRAASAHSAVPQYRYAGCATLRVIQQC
jgi:hypothetical protein